MDPRSFRRLETKGRCTNLPYLVATSTEARFRMVPVSQMSIPAQCPGHQCEAAVSFCARGGHWGGWGVASPAPGTPAPAQPNHYLYMTNHYLQFT